MLRDLLVVALVCAGCASAPPPAPSQLDDDGSAYARVVQHASEDFDCPVDRITPAPCVCSGAFALNVCDVAAVYDWRRRDDGGLDVILVSAFGSSASPAPSTSPRSPPPPPPPPAARE